MKILIDLSVLELPATGIARVIVGLYRAIGARYPHIDLRGIHRRKLASEIPACIRSERTGSILPFRLWRHFAIPYAANRSGQAILHFPWNGMVPPLAPRWHVVTTIHDVLPLIIPGFFANDKEAEHYRKERQSDIDRSRIVVTDSEFSRREIMRHLLVKREPIVIPCATDIGMHAPAVMRTQMPYFLYVGGLDPRKSVDMLLRVFLGLAAQDRLQSRLIVAGSSRHAQSSLRQLLDDGVRSGHVEQRGYVTDQELAGLYLGALALVYPSRYEGFGMPPLEAMTMGCPVITYRATSIPEVCGEAAHYIDPADEQSLAEALMIFERDQSLRRRLSAEGRKRAARFSWDTSAEAFLKVLEMLTYDQT